MESIGDRLRKTREEKGFSLDQVARDTHITKRFLEALEAEAYESLPGESYVLGFLRTYSDYLGLDPEDAVQLYRNIKLQEQPAPMEELLDRRGGISFTKVAIFALILAGLGIGIWFLYTTAPVKDDTVVTDQARAVPEGTVVFDGKLLERAFVEGTVFLFSLPGGDRLLKVSYAQDRPVIALNGVESSLTLEEDAILDLDDDGSADVRLRVRSVDTRTSPVRLVLRIDRQVEGDTVVSPLPVAGTAPVAPADTAFLASLPDPGQPSGVFPAKSPRVLAENSAKTALTGTLSFTSPVWFRYVSDSGDDVERFSTAGETLNLSAAELVRISVSDAGRAKLTMGGQALELGAPGEIASWQILWTGTAGRFRLEMQPLF